MKTFDFGYGPVPARKHSNGGGWVALTANVDDTAYINIKALVSGNAYISTSKFPQMKRSDGYDFIAVPCKDEVTRVLAGCRYFTFEEANEHWEKTRGGTPLGNETMLILKYLKAYTELC